MKKWIILFFIFVLNACAAMDEQSGSDAQQTASVPLSFDARTVTKDLSFYVRGMMQELIENMRYVNQNTPVAVASFVLLDGDYQTTNLLGKQISESLIHEIHKFGIPVVDYKMMHTIKVADNGDFIFSRNPKDLDESMPAHYVFAGTIAEVPGGYMVNARAIGIKSRAVVASAQAILPAVIFAKTSDSDNAKKRKASDPQMVKITKN